MSTAIKIQLNNIKDGECLGCDFLKEEKCILFDTCLSLVGIRNTSCIMCEECLDAALLTNKIPQIGRIYNCFDDGKIHKGRHYKIKVKKVIFFGDIDADTLKLWEKEVNNCPWLYKESTDFFVIGMNEKLNKQEIFVRSTDNGWFGIGGFLCCGRLDIDGSLVKLLD